MTQTAVSWGTVLYLVDSPTTPTTSLHKCCCSSCYLWGHNINHHPLRNGNLCVQHGNGFFLTFHWHCFHGAGTHKFNTWVTIMVAHVPPMGCQEVVVISGTSERPGWFFLNQEIQDPKFPLCGSIEMIHLSKMVKKQIFCSSLNAASEMYMYIISTAPVQLW